MMRMKPAKKQRSIAEVASHFAETVREAEVEPVEITRRGKRVAVLLSAEVYERVRQAQKPFWKRLEEWRAANPVREGDPDMDWEFPEFR